MGTGSVRNAMKERGSCQEGAAKGSTALIRARGAARWEVTPSLRRLGQFLGQFRYWKSPYRGCTDTEKSHIHPGFTLVFPTFRSETDQTFNP